MNLVCCDEKINGRSIRRFNQNYSAKARGVKFSQICRAYSAAFFSCSIGKFKKRMTLFDITPEGCGLN